MRKNDSGCLLLLTLQLSPIHSSCFFNRAKQMLTSNPDHGCCRIQWVRWTKYLLLSLVVNLVEWQKLVLPFFRPWGWGQVHKKEERMRMVLANTKPRKSFRTRMFPVGAIHFPLPIESVINNHTWTDKYLMDR